MSHEVHRVVVGADAPENAPLIEVTARPQPFLVSVDGTFVKILVVPAAQPVPGDKPPPDPPGPEPVGPDAEAALEGGGEHVPPLEEVGADAYVLDEFDNTIEDAAGGGLNGGDGG